MLGKIDYWVTGVSYIDTGGHRSIDRLEIHPNIGNTHEHGELWSRDEVIDKTELYIFATIARDQKGNWRKLAEIKRLYLDGVFFLRTDDEKIHEDYLGDLPELTTEG